ncbi:MAG: hypothetical protein J6Q06_02500, partial [Clostridia bacterium]|nr:hypothetical protein [Clostridia bacterium]
IISISIQPKFTKEPICSNVFQHKLSKKTKPTFWWGLAEAVGFVETKFRNSAVGVLAHKTSVSHE